MVYLTVLVISDWMEEVGAHWWCCSEKKSLVQLPGMVPLTLFTVVFSSTERSMLTS